MPPPISSTPVSPAPTLLSPHFCRKRKNYRQEQSPSRPLWRLGQLYITRRCVPLLLGGVPSDAPAQFPGEPTEDMKEQDILACSPQENKQQTRPASCRARRRCKKFPGLECNTGSDQLLNPGLPGAPPRGEESMLPPPPKLCAPSLCLTQSIKAGSKTTTSRKPALTAVPSFPLVHARELEAIKLKLWAMEQAQGPEQPRAQAQAGEEAGMGTTLAGQLLSPKTGCPSPGTPTEKVQADHRSIYVGNVDYGGTAEELEAYFNQCGEIRRVTILCDKFSGHPKGYAYIEFATESAAQTAVELDESIFRGRVIKVLPKRTNLPGISSTDRGGLRGHPGARGEALPHSSLQGGTRFRPRGRGRCLARCSPWYSPY
ncbi:embryonic polyadenylate-binding protein 2 [Equus asinus]|uniref:embryonic polyadenylate-binding protein 2 n=1 Tax=Equus asinus TaxID=9793 RepID=UPI0038F74D28